MCSEISQSFMPLLMKNGHLEHINSWNRSFKHVTPCLEQNMAINFKLSKDDIWCIKISSTYTPGFLINTYLNKLCKCFRYGIPIQICFYILIDWFFFFFLREKKIDITTFLASQLAIWRYKESGHQQPCYWTSFLDVFLEYCGLSFVNTQMINITQYHISCYCIQCNNGTTYFWH